MPEQLVGPARRFEAPAASAPSIAASAGLGMALLFLLGLHVFYPDEITYSVNLIIGLALTAASGIWWLIVDRLSAPATRTAAGASLAGAAALAAGALVAVAAAAGRADWLWRRGLPLTWGELAPLGVALALAVAGMAASAAGLRRATAFSPRWLLSLVLLVVSAAIVLGVLAMTVLRNPVNWRWLP